MFKKGEKVYVKDSERHKGRLYRVEYFDEKDGTYVCYRNRYPFKFKPEQLYAPKEY